MIDPQIKTAPLAEAEEFQPDAIMLESKEPPCSARIVWFVLIALLLVMTGWAAFAKVDKIVNAEGKIVTTRPTITMKPLEISIVKRVHVRVGQHVQKDQLLFSFEPVAQKSEWERLSRLYDSLSAACVRLKKEMEPYSDTPVFNKPENEKTDDERMQEKIYDARKKFFREKIRFYDETIARYKLTLDQLEISLTKYEKRKEFIQKIDDMYASLKEQKVVSLKDWLQARVTMLETDISVDNQQNQITENRKQIESTKAERAAFIRDWQRNIVETYVSDDRDRISYSKYKEKSKLYLDYAEMRAPCEAVVHEMAPYQEGSAVREAEPLITLVPLNCEMEAEINIPAKDIGWVRTGDNCELKFDAFPYQQWGTLQGKIAFISHDAFLRQDNSQDARISDDGGRRSPEAQASRYQANLKISGQFKGIHQDQKLLPGMRLTAEIKVGQRSVLSYLFNPFLKSIQEFGREP